MRTASVVTHNSDVVASASAASRRGWRLARGLGIGRRRVARRRVALGDHAVTREPTVAREQLADLLERGVIGSASA
jgi:hypothetical protein